MRISSRCFWLFALLAVLSTILAAQSDKKANKSSLDEPAIRDYVLTMPKVQKFSEVARKINLEGKSDPVMVAEMNKISDSDADDLNKAVMMEKSPHIAAFFKANGITARDFVLTPMTVMTAALAVAAQDMKADIPDFVNPANIQFVRDHKAELEKYHLLGGEKDSDPTPDSNQ